MLCYDMILYDMEIMANDDHHGSWIDTSSEPFLMSVSDEMNLQSHG